MPTNTQTDLVLARLAARRPEAIAKVRKYLPKVSEQTVRNWVRNGFIPQQHHETLLLGAQRDGLPLVPHDFVQYLYGPAIAAQMGGGKPAASAAIHA